MLLLQVKVWFQNRRTKYKRMKAEEAENGGEPREKDPDAHESHDSDIDMGEHEGSPCGSPKPECYANGHSSEEDDIEIEASDSEDDLLHHHQSIMAAAQFRLYQSAAEVAHPNERQIIGSPPSPNLVQSQPFPDVSWAKESPKV